MYDSDVFCFVLGLGFFESIFYFSFLLISITTTNASAISGDVHCKNSHEMIDNLQLQPGWGVMGLGDESFGISVESIVNADGNIPSFVSTFSNAWRQRTSQQIKETRIPAGTTHRSCYEERGFCMSSLKGQSVKYQRIVDHFIKFLQVHRKRHLVRGRNMGPSADVSLPLVLVTEKNLDNNLLTCYLSIGIIFVSFVLLVLCL